MCHGRRGISLISNLVLLWAGISLGLDLKTRFSFSGPRRFHEVKRKCGKGEFIVSVSLIGRKKIPFSFLVEDFDAYRLCTFWSLVEVEKKSCFEE